MSKRKTLTRRDLCLRAARHAAARGDHARARNILALEDISYVAGDQIAAPGSAP